ncbi:MAG TPA: DUF6325 family protein [Conexibacter sp.]|nr:DUF6325 family protein [Conexibacter sp.]
MTDVERTQELGPVQLLVLGFQDADFQGEILAELARLRELGTIRVIDLLVVAKDHDGELASIELSDLSDEEAAEFGAIAGALIGLGAGGEEGARAGALAGAEAFADRERLDEEEVWYAADAIPEGGTAAIALIEHRWAIPLRDAIVRTGGVTLADAWIHPADLVAIGAAAAAP